MLFVNLRVRGAGAREGRPCGRGWIPASAGMTDAERVCAGVRLLEGEGGGGVFDEADEGAGVDAEEDDGGEEAEKGAAQG